MKFKKGETYVCTKTNEPYWTVGGEYAVTESRGSLLAIIDDDGDYWCIGTAHIPNTEFKLKEEQKMTITVQPYNVDEVRNSANTQVKEVSTTYSQEQVDEVLSKACTLFDNDSQRLAFIKGYFAK